MSDSTVWWIVACAMVAVELLTGTFYLLMLALGMSSGAIAAHLGYSVTAQMVTAALVGGGSVAIWYQIQQRKSSRLDANKNHDANLDIGETVFVDSWSPDGTTSVKYRGAQWTAMHRSGNLPTSGGHRIVEVKGSQLIIEKFEP